MSDGDEDNKATVVIDLNELKKERERREQEIAAMATDLEFQVEDSQAELKPIARAAAALPIVVFEYEGHAFLEGDSPEGQAFHHVTNLPELNAWLKKKTPLVVVFNLSSNPKAINQLCAQLRIKFPHAKLVLAAKKLAPEKIALHQRSPARADAYLQLPLTAAQLLQAVGSLKISKVG